MISRAVKIRNQEKTSTIRANGLQAWTVLGLLSGMVGLLISCVYYQEVIIFSLTVAI